MTNTQRFLLQLWFFLGLPLLGVVFVRAFGNLGVFLFLILCVLWCWELFAFAHYRYCRQEELGQVMMATMVTQAPVEGVLRAYYEDRSSGPGYHFLVAVLLFFVFPGYYWIHVRRSFDMQVRRLLHLLYDGQPLDKALALVPGLVAPDVVLGFTASRLTGRSQEPVNQLTQKKPAPPWLEAAPRLAYPFLLVLILLNIVAFLSIFIIPKFEKIYADFHLKLPAITSTLIAIARRILSNGMIPLGLWALGLSILNLLLFSSWARWHTPVIGRVYRMRVRGQFLQALGLLLESGKPLPEILEAIHASGQLPAVLDARLRKLAVDLSAGQPLAAGLARHGIVTRSMESLIAAAERARNLPWAVRELGESLARRGAQLGQKLTAVLFPLSVFGCACLIGLVAVAMFQPLITLMDSMHGK